MPESRNLIDVTDLAEADPADMLGAVATGGAQLRDGFAAAGAACTPLIGTARPRALVVAGMGGSAAAGDVLAALADGEVPVVVHRGYGLPGWVGSSDLVAAVSCSGQTEETLSAVAEARRRGVRLVTIGAADSDLAQICAAASGLHLAVDAAGRQPRACLWSLAGPLLAAARALSLIDLPATAVAAAADILDQAAQRCAADVPAADNPAQDLARTLAGGLPMVWGFSTVAAAAAARFGNQLAENAKLPAVVGAGSEPHHNQVVAFDRTAHADGPSTALRLLVLRDSVEDPRLARRAVESLRLAAEAGLTAHQVQASGDHPLVRLADLTGLLDFTSVYSALLRGVDPTPVTPIVTLKRRLAAP